MKSVENNFVLTDVCGIPKQQWCEEHRKAYAFCEYILGANLINRNGFISFVLNKIYPHFIAEEKVSFPCAVRKYPKSKGATMELLQEHKNFRRLVNTIINSRDEDTVIYCINLFCEKLKSHIKKEENYFKVFCV